MTTEKRDSNKNYAKMWVPTAIGLLIGIPLAFVADSNVRVALTLTFLTTLIGLFIGFIFRAEDQRSQLESLEEHFGNVAAVLQLEQCPAPARDNIKSIIEACSRIAVGRPALEPVLEASLY